MNQYDGMSINELQGYFSDFHKDLFGVRPRYQTVEQMNNRGWLIHEIESLHDHLDKMKATPAGKRQLEMEGWSFD
jgi:hypothetical protein